ncbi:molybdenum cofactor guanylyltransferase [Kytococcus sp. Marseille-QA3725]
MSPVHDAIVLAGGTGRRLGGVSKGDVELAGQRMLDRVLAAAAGARCTVVVGDPEVPAGVLRTVEDPPRSGPAAGIAAGLGALGEDAGGDDPSDWVLVLATDAPGLVRVVPGLLAAADRAEAEESAGEDGPHAGADGFAPQDATGHRQWLGAVYRRTALLRALDELGDPTDRPVKALVGRLDLRRADPADEHDVEDVDTWEDHARWTARLTAGGEA